MHRPSTQGLPACLGDGGAHGHDPGGTPLAYADPVACPCLPSAAYGLIVRPNDFASYLLAIGICNLLLYFAFYIIMKVQAGCAGAACPVGRAGQGRAPLSDPACTSTRASPAAPQRRAHQAHPLALHRRHLSGVGLCPLLLLPGAQHLAGKWEGGAVVSQGGHRPVR